MSRAPPGVIVPPGQYPPFATVTDTDHSAWVIIATALALSLSVLFAGIRVFIRSNFSREYGLDDLAMAFSTGFAAIQSVLVLVACANGLGKSISIVPLEMQNKVQRLCYASNLLYVLTLGLSRASVGFFLLRLTPIKEQRIFAATVLGLIATWTATFFLAIALQCDLKTPWLVIGQKCSKVFPRWAIFEGIGCLFEMSHVALSIWLVWDLRTKLGNKIMVVLAFAFRLPLIAFAALRLANFDVAGLTADPFILEASFVAWTQIELNYSLISATIPAMRTFVNSFVTHYGAVRGMGESGPGEDSGESGTRIGKFSKDRSFPMKSLKSSSAMRSVNSEAEPDARTFVKLAGEERAEYSYSVTAGPQSSPNKDESGQNTDGASIASQESNTLMIRRVVSWQSEPREPVPSF